MEKRSRNLVYKTEKIRLGQKELLVWERDPEKGLICRTIPYHTMVLVYLEVYDEKNGETITPEIQDITKDMKGSLIIWDLERKRFRIDLSDQKDSAGTVFIRLARHIPFAFLGYTPWMQIQDDQDFRQMLKMIAINKKVNRVGGHDSA